LYYGRAAFASTVRGLHLANPINNNFHQGETSMFTKDRFLPDMVVRSADGDKLGKVVSSDDNGVYIQKGIFFPKDYFASFDQIESISGDEIYLRWGTELVRENYDKFYGAGSYDKETRDESTWTDYDWSRRKGWKDTASTSASESREHMSVPLREDELQGNKTGMKETGRVRIVKTVTTEDKHFTVPLRREEIHIERDDTSSDLDKVRDLNKKKVI